MDIKRFLAGGLVALMLLPALSSCKKGEEPDASGSDTSDLGLESGTVDVLAGKTPLDAYKQALEKVNSMTAYELEIENVYLYSYQGTTEDTSTVKETYRVSGDTLYYHENYNDFGSTEYWYVGETLYSNTDGVKEKKTLSKDEYKLELALESTDIMFTIGDSAFEGKTFEAQDGTYYVSVEASVTECGQFLGLTLKNNAICTVGFNESGDIVSFSANAVYDTESGIGMDITKTVKFTKIGDVAAVSAPEDADSYTVAAEE